MPIIKEYGNSSNHKNNILFIISFIISFVVLFSPIELVFIHLLQRICPYTMD